MELADVSPFTCYGTACPAQICVVAVDPILTVQEAHVWPDRRLFLTRSKTYGTSRRCLVRHAV